MGAPSSGIAAGRLRVGEPRTERLLDEIVHHRLRRVINPVALALRELRDGVAALQLAFPVFQFGNGLLEDVAKRVKAQALSSRRRARRSCSGRRDRRSVVVIALKRRLVRALSSLDEDVVWNVQAVDERVRLQTIRR